MTGSSNQNLYDVIVVGLGGAGLACLMELARAGYRVCGVEQFEAEHRRGGSRGETRLFRTAYFEGSAYVPALKYCRDQWLHWNDRAGQELFTSHGLVLFGCADRSEVLAGTIRSADEHDIALQELRCGHALRSSFSQLPSSYRAVLEETAGMIHSDRTLAALQYLATQSGAECLYQTRVESYHREGEYLSVHLGGSDRRFARYLILCPGAWLPHIQPSTTARIELNYHLWWDIPDFDPPCSWGIDTEDGFFYGMPRSDDNSYKVNLHGSGINLEDPEERPAGAEEQLIARVERFIRRKLTSRPVHLRRSQACLYMNSADRHFDINRIHPKVLRIAALSGHGFKFLPAFGLAALQHVAHPMTARLPSMIGAFGKCAGEAIED